MKRMTKLIREANQIAKLYNSYIPKRKDKSIIDYDSIMFVGKTETIKRSMGLVGGTGTKVKGKGKLK